MTTFTTADRLQVEQHSISESIIIAKKLLVELELLTACPTRTNWDQVQLKLIKLDKATSQIWIEYDGESNA